MNAREFARSMRAAADFVERIGLLEVASNLTSLEPSAEFFQAAVSGDYSYRELYQIGLHNLDYNILLCDLSYLQFHYSTASAPFGVRYAFYPNPFDFTPFEEFVSEFGLDGAPNAYEDYLSFLADERESTKIPTVRYDLAFRDYHELVHPTAHFHLGLHTDNRWPVKRVLSPYVFTLLITKMFFGQKWRERGKSRDETELNTFDVELSRERDRCQPLSVDFFSEREERQFHFS
jgi:hypothetical protein